MRDAKALGLTVPFRSAPAPTLTRGHRIGSAEWREASEYATQAAASPDLRQLGKNASIRAKRSPVNPRSGAGQEPVR
jgi:hypothetical protein